MTHKFFRSYLTAFLGFLLVLSILSLQLQLGHATSKSPYDSGYDHGCDDADISDPNERYINQPEKGPSFHTNEFMNGYNDGYDACSSNVSSGGSDDSDTSSNGGNEDGSGNGLNILVHFPYDAGELCLYKVNQDRGDNKLDCSTLDGPGTITFTTNAIVTGERFKVCEQYSLDCKFGVNGSEKAPEHVYFD